MARAAAQRAAASPEPARGRIAQPEAHAEPDYGAEARRVAAVLRRGRCALLATRLGLVALCPTHSATQALRRHRPDVAAFSPREWRELMDAAPEEAELIVACKRHLGGALLPGREPDSPSLAEGGSGDGRAA